MEEEGQRNFEAQRILRYLRLSGSAHPGLVVWSSEGRGDARGDGGVAGAAGVPVWSACGAVDSGRAKGERGKGTAGPPMALDPWIVRC